MTKPKVRKRARKPNTPSAELRNAVTQLLRDRAPARLSFNEITAVLLRKGYRFTDSALKNALTDYREPQALTSPKQVKAAAAPVPSGIAVDLAVALYRYEVDAVEVERTSVLGSGRVRIDKVIDEQKPYWLSTWLEQAELALPGDWKTLTRWRLPLVALNDPSRQLPGLAVQLFADAKAAADRAHRMLQGNDPSAGRYQVTVEECSPAEADRRLNARGLLTRRHGTGGRTGTSRIAEVSCLKCGLPLSDPASVKIGIGPECRRRIGDDVIQALRNPTPQRRELIGAKRPKQWAIAIRSRFDQDALRTDDATH